MLRDISETVNARALNPLPLCSAPLKLTCSNFWSSRNKRKQLPKQNCVLRKCCLGPPKWLMLELSILCIVFSNPDNLLVGITGTLGTKEIYFLSKNVFWGSVVGYLRNGECYGFQTFAIVFSTFEKLTWWDFWSSRNKRKQLPKQKCVLIKCSGVLQKRWMLEL